MPNASAMQTARDIRLPGQDLTLEETLRVMDVAREMRDRRETAEEMFRRDDFRNELRQKLLRTAQLSGDKVTAAEIDAAIDQYLSRLHTYSDPEPGFKSFVAHCWVWRKRILAGVAATAFAAASLWFLFASPIAPLSPTLRAQRAVAAEVESASSTLDRIRSMTDDVEVIQMAERLQGEIRSTSDVTQALAARNRLDEIASTLAEEYEIRIVAGTNDKSGLERSFQDRPSIFYVFVEARTSDGKVISRQIRNSETDKPETVTRWAVQISESAYRRLAADKSDGVLNETVYAVKQRGEMQPTIQLDGAVVKSPSTLTQWK